MWVWVCVSKWMREFAAAMCWSALATTAAKSFVENGCTSIETAAAAAAGAAVSISMSPFERGFRGRKQKKAMQSSALSVNKSECMCVCVCWKLQCKCQLPKLTLHDICTARGQRERRHAKKKKRRGRNKRRKHFHCELIVLAIVWPSCLAVRCTSVRAEREISTSRENHWYSSTCKQLKHWYFVPTAHTHTKPDKLKDTHTLSLTHTLYLQHTPTLIETVNFHFTSGEPFFFPFHFLVAAKFSILKCFTFFRSLSLSLFPSA